MAAQVQEHERAPGGWHTDWMTLPALALVTSGALGAVVEIAEGLEIDVERLRANLELTGGQIMAEAVSFALAEKIGRAEAHALVREISQQAAKDKRPLKELLLNDIRVKSQLGGLEIEKLFIPLTYQGSAQTFIDRLVVASQMRAPRRTEPAPPKPAPPVAPALPPAPAAATDPPRAGMPQGPGFAPSPPPAEPPAAGLELPVPPLPEPRKETGALMDVLSGVTDDGKAALPEQDDRTRKIF
jgi:3-carboxy-cis,cis-muconate cycloisomerase